MKALALCWRRENTENAVVNVTRPWPEGPDYSARRRVFFWRRVVFAKST